ncbi:MAG: hypothetical protein ACKOOG_13760 [Actinomycetota bacterium]
MTGFDPVGIDRDRGKRSMVARRVFRFGVAALVAVGAGIGLMASASDATLTTPGAPTSLTVVLGRAVGEVKLTWTAPAATGGGIGHYAISTATVTGGVTGAWSTPQTTGSIGTRATQICGASYPSVCRYRVYAVNSAGTSTASNEVSMAWSAPTAASRTRAVPLTLHDFTANDVTWSAPSRTGGLPVSYDVQIRVDGGAWTDVATGLSVRTLADDDNCTGGTSCLYRVRAKNAVGVGPTSNSSALMVRPTVVTELGVRVTDTDPTMGNPTSGGTEATVTWQMPRAGLVDDDYEVSICQNLCTATSGTWTSPAPVAGLSTVVPCAADYRTCTYRVRATNSLGGVGAWSYRAISPFAPSVVSAATGSAVDTIAVSFYGVAESGLGLIADKYFRFAVCTASCGSAVNWLIDENENVALSSIPAYPATATVACPGGTTCQVRVRFVDGEDNGSALSPVTAATGADVPGDPTGLSVVTGSTSGTVDASWTAPTNLGTPALAQYQTRYSTDAGVTFSAWSNTGGTGTTRTISCGAGETCDVEVRAVNAIGSGASASDSATAADVPGQLTGFSATYGAGVADLAWTLGSSSPAITDIEYQLSTDGGTTWGEWTSLATTGSSATIAACSSTTNDTCDYRVSAVNAIGNGSVSATSGFTIP